jgi:hypothetical protein
MNPKERKAEMRNKLQSLRTTIEWLEKGENVSKAMLKTNMRDLKSLEELVDGIKGNKM